MNFEGELGELIEAHGIRHQFTASEAPWQNGLERCRSTRFRGHAKTRIHGELGKKNARINSSGYSPAQWVIGRGYKLPWSLLDEKQGDELASLQLPDHSPEFGRRMSWLWAARRAFETMDTSHRLRRALLAGVRASSHTQGIETGELVFVWRKVKKNRTDAWRALVTHRWYGPAIVVGKENNHVIVSYLCRVTKVAPECFRNASFAEQMSWDITTMEKALFEMTLDKENLSWEEPLLDESGEVHEFETPHTMARPLNLSEEVNSPMNDDGDPPLFL